MSNFVHLPDLKGYLGVTKTSNDLVLQKILDAAERFCERRARRRFSPDPPLTQSGTAPNFTYTDDQPAVSKLFTTRGRLTIRIPDLRTQAVDPAAPAPIIKLATVTLTDDYVDLGDDAGVWAEPATQIQINRYVGNVAGPWLVVPGFPRMHDLEIIGKWGWYPTPPDILDVVLALAARMYRERDASWSDSVQLGDGSILSYFRQLPARVQAQLDTYRQPNIALVGGKVQL